MYLSVSDVKTTVATMEWQPVEIPVNYLSGDVFGLAVCVPLDYPLLRRRWSGKGRVCLDYLHARDVSLLDLRPFLMLTDSFRMKISRGCFIIYLSTFSFSLSSSGGSF